jgi:hypothetical protein
MVYDQLAITITDSPYSQSFFFFFFEALGFGFSSSSSYSLSHSTSPFCVKYFRDRISWTICLGWLRTIIILIPVSWVARITDVSHWRPALLSLKSLFFHFFLSSSQCSLLLAAYQCILCTYRRLNQAWEEIIYEAGTSVIQHNVLK